MRRHQPQPSVGVLKLYYGLPCPYCRKAMTKRGNGKHSATRDHIVPKSKGAWDIGVRNVIVACKNCNCDKDSKTLAEFYIWLHRSSDPRAQIVYEFMQRICQTVPTIAAHKLIGFPVDKPCFVNDTERQRRLHSDAVTVTGAD